MKTPNSPILLAFGITALFVWLAFSWSAESRSSDLMAVWLAGHFYSLGQLDQIYPEAGRVFTMQPPDQWASVLQKTPYVGPVFPFVYPPIWAAVGSLIPDYSAFRGVALFTSFLNSAFLAATGLLAWRATRTRMNPAIYILIVYSALAFSVVGAVGLLENQPQILVSFLIVLTIERSRAHAQYVAGIALAIAAAIKIYPALFALLWLATGQKRAFVSFILVGGALGATSILVVGWPLHAQFIQQLTTISNTALITNISFNLNSFFAQIFIADQMILIHPTEVNELLPTTTGWFYLQLTELWKWAARVLLLLSVAWLLRRTARADDQERHTVLWPLATIIFALLAPLSWCYYYIPAFAFLPTLIDRLGARLGALAILFITSLLAFPFVPFFRKLDLFPADFQIIGTLAILALGLFFYFARRPGQN